MFPLLTLFSSMSLVRMSVLPALLSQCVCQCAIPLPLTTCEISVKDTSRTYLLKASTTMNTTLSKIAFGLPSLSSSPNPTSSVSASSKVASPARKGLYGKNPVANTKAAIGINIFARMRPRVRDLELVRGILGYYRRLDRGARSISEFQERSVMIGAP